MVHLFGRQASAGETSGRKSNCLTIARWLVRGIPTMLIVASLYLIYTSVVWPLAEIARFYLHGNLREKLSFPSEYVLASNTNGRFIGSCEDAPYGKLSFIVVETNGNFSIEFSCSERRCRVFSHPRSGLVTSFLFSSLRSCGSSNRNESAAPKKSRSRWSSTKLNRSPHAEREMSCTNCSVFTNC